jgi:hypothetical protein
MTYEEWFNSAPISDLYRGFKVRFDGRHADIFTSTGWIVGYFYTSSFESAIKEFQVRIDLLRDSKTFVDALSPKFKI